MSNSRLIMTFNREAFFYNVNLSWQTETDQIKRECISVILNGWMIFMALYVFKDHISEMYAVIATPVS